MHTEGSEYLYMKQLDAPKAWFQANADRILDNYGQEHNIQKEDLMLGESRYHFPPPILTFYAVISLLQAPNYAIFVSHSHPEAQVSTLSFADALAISTVNMS